MPARKKRLAAARKKRPAAKKKARTVVKPRGPSAEELHSVDEAWQKLVATAVEHHKPQPGTRSNARKKSK